MKHDQAHYRCCNRLRPEPHLRICTEPEFFAALADTAVWNWLRDLLSDEASINEGLRAMEARREGHLAESLNRLAAVDASRHKLDRKLQRLMSAFDNEPSETVRAALQEEVKGIARQKDALTQEYTQLKAQLTQAEARIDTPQAIKARIATIRKMLDRATFEDKRHVLDLLDVRVQLQRHGKKRFLAGCATPPRTGGLEQFRPQFEMRRIHARAADRDDLIFERLAQCFERALIEFGQLVE